MPKDSPDAKKLIEMASEIVQTQVSLSPMSTADIAYSLRRDFSTLQEMQKAEAGGLPEKLRQCLEARRQGKAAASTQGTTETATGCKAKRTRLRKKKYEI